MKKCLLLVTIAFSINAMSGSYNLFCEGSLSTGAKISFDREDFAKVSISQGKEPGNILTMKVSEGTLFPKEAFELNGYAYQKGMINIIKVVSEDDFSEGGDLCNGGYTSGVYGSTKVVKATYEDHATEKELIELTCVERGAYSGNCFYDL